MHPKPIHKDGLLCHSKSAWASLNKKPPLKNFELPDQFSDNEDVDTQKTPTTQEATAVNTENSENTKQSPNTDIAITTEDTTSMKVLVNTGNNNTAVSPENRNNKPDCSDLPAVRMNEDEVVHTSRQQNKRDFVLVLSY